MTQSNGHAPVSVNELERRMVGEPTIPARSGNFLPRYRRRRVDLMSLDGVLRESRRNYLEWRTGRLDAESYLVAVRGISSHKDILAVKTQTDQIVALQEQLSALQGAPVVLPAFDASPVPDLQQQLADSDLVPQ